MSYAKTLFPAALLLALLPGCDLTDAVADDAGFETGPCIEGECFDGLQCLSDLCVEDEDSGSGGQTSSPGTNPTSASGGDSSASATASASGGDDGGGDDGGGDDGGGDDGGGGDDTGGADDTGGGDDDTGGGADDGGADDGGADDGGADDGGDDTGFVPGEDCDIYQQDCPEGAKCNPYSNDGGSNWNDVGCFPVVPGPDQPGESCTVEDSGTSGYDSCDVGSMCWDVDVDTNIGVCVAMCEGSPMNPTCDDASATCTIANDGVINLCLPGCDPLTQNCPGGQGCYPVDDAFVCAPDASGDAGVAGDGCQFINSCAPGLACIATDAYGPACLFGGAGCCSPFCDTDAPAACPEADQECTGWFEEGVAPVGLDDVGVCTVPQ